jgi:hypothetical protein
MPASTFARLHNASVAVGNGAELKVEGFESASFQISGTFVATLTFEGSVDGTTFFAVPAYPSDGGALQRLLDSGGSTARPSRRCGPASVPTPQAASR